MNIPVKTCAALAALLLRLEVASCAALHPLHPLQRRPLELPWDSALAALSAPAVIVLVPRARAGPVQRTRHEAADADANRGTVDEDLESVTVEADPEGSGSDRAVVLVPPNAARLSIGDVISAIPFLPIEINVPDAIGWAYGGISGGISGIISIFDRWPFVSGGAQGRGGLGPVVILPVVPRAVPIRLPIQV